MKFSSDIEAIRFLEERGFTVSGDGVIYFTSSPISSASEEELEAADYLFNEWDYCLYDEAPLSHDSTNDC